MFYSVQTVRLDILLQLVTDCLKDISLKKKAFERVLGSARLYSKLRLVLSQRNGPRRMFSVLSQALKKNEKMLWQISYFMKKCGTCSHSTYY